MNPTPEGSPEAIPTITSVVPSSETSSKAKQWRAAPFAFALLCFLLPFVKLSCVADPSEKIRVQGKALVFGGEVSKDGKSDRIKPRPWAIAGFVLTALAVLVALMGKHSLAAGTGIGAAVVIFGFKMNLAAETQKESGGLVRADMDIGMMLALLLLVVGAFVCGYLAKQPQVTKSG